VKVTIITPSYNAGPLVEETISSVLDQTAVKSGRLSLEYFVCDGGSTDETLAVVESLDHPGLHVVCEPDNGMYHALAKGLQRASGDIVAYLNAGDYYHKCALDVVTDVFEAYKEIDWLTGTAVFYNERSQVIGSRLPGRYRRRLFECGIYGRVLPFLQQESTFWRSAILGSVDLDVLSSFRLAGDYYLWQCFSKVADLYVVESQLGGFKFHDGQLSENRVAYLAELSNICIPPGPRDYAVALWDLLVWFSHDEIKKLLNRKHMLAYDRHRKQWR
jgi:glycosyltransferase involved in cell wall biosynthesis